MMRIKGFRVTNYRSIHDTGWCEVEPGKTIMVGPNEAGKSAILAALQYIKPPKGIRPLDPLRDFPRARYNEITTGQVDPSKTKVVEAHMSLDEKDLAALPPGFEGAVYVIGKNLDNKHWHTIHGGPEVPSFGDLEKDLLRLVAHLATRPNGEPLKVKYEAIAGTYTATTRLDAQTTKPLEDWLSSVVPHVDEANATEEGRLDRLRKRIAIHKARETALATLFSRLPVIVLFNNYFRVRPRIHLAQLAQRLKTGVLDDEQYDYGNVCLLKLLGFTAEQLSALGNAPNPGANDSAALQRYQDQLDNRSYQLNAASVRLTSEIQSAWNPDTSKGEANRLRIVADGQYLKVVVEDDVGVEVELDQRSEGYQWLVSFFVVFFAEASGQHENAILLLDEPGMSLHGLKQREFRSTITKLAERNQTIFTTHSPFLVGPDELDAVRVVEMANRRAGTKIHTTLTAGDDAALLPLQEALGYDLAQSLFAQQRNLICEGLTDYWYVDATAQLLRDAGAVDLNQRIALIPAHGAGKVAYFATILHAHSLKVAALLDSDAAGESAAKQETLVHTLRNKGILRTRDYFKGEVSAPEIEDLLRETLIRVAKEELGVDVSQAASSQPKRSITQIIESSTAVTKYQLAKAYLRWTRNHTAADLPDREREQWVGLVKAINAALR